MDVALAVAVVAVVVAVTVAVASASAPASASTPSAAAAASTSSAASIDSVHLVRDLALVTALGLGLGLGRLAGEIIDLSGGLLPGLLVGGTFDAGCGGEVRIEGVGDVTEEGEPHGLVDGPVFLHNLLDAMCHRGGDPVVFEILDGKHLGGDGEPGDHGDLGLVIVREVGRRPVHVGVVRDRPRRPEVGDGGGVEVLVRRCDSLLAGNEGGKVFDWLKCAVSRDSELLIPRLLVGLGDSDGPVPGLVAQRVYGHLRFLGPERCLYQLFVGRPVLEVTPEDGVLAVGEVEVGLRHRAQVSHGLPDLPGGCWSWGPSHLHPGFPVGEPVAEVMGDGTHVVVALLLGGKGEAFKVHMVY